MLTRQQQRYEQRKQMKEQESLRKQMNSPATKGDFFALLDSFNKLRDRLFQLDIINAGLERIIRVKGIATRDEIKEAIEYESKRALKLREINQMTGNYDERVKLCKEWEIDIEFTNIPNQILNDANLTKQQKDDLFQKYNIKVIQGEQNV